MKARLAKLAVALSLGSIVAPVLLAQNFSADELNKRTIERRAVEAVIWGMVLFLCSDLASFAVGQTFVIDGGYTTH